MAFYHYLCYINFTIMKFTPETYNIPDKPMTSFIDADEIWNFLNNTVSTKERVREVIAKSLSKKRLNLEETAVLINATDPELIQEIKEGAKTLTTGLCFSHRFMWAINVRTIAPIAVSEHQIQQKCAKHYRMKN